MTFLRNGTNLDTLFEARLSTAASPVYFIDGSDLSQKYEKIASGSNIGYDVGFTYNGNDIRNIFAGLGTVSGYLYDASLTYLEMHYYWSWDGKAWSQVQDHVYVYWGGAQNTILQLILP